MVSPQPAPTQRSGRVQVGTYITRKGDEAPLELAYDRFGPGGGVPLLLVMGLGAQRIFWTDEMCAELVAAGFDVVRFDNRDVGESTKLDAATPDPWRSLARRFAGMPLTAPYDLSDMARDVVGLLDALSWPSAHVVGASLGGMIAQHLAIEHPTRVRSITAIMTTSGSRRYLPEPRALGALFAKAPKTVEEAGDHIIATFTIIGSPGWPLDTERMRELGKASYRRGPNPRGFLRQFTASLVSGDRRAQLIATQTPTLVVHGTRDPLFPLPVGRTLARLLPNATWLPIAGMGHDIPPPLWPTLVRAIARHSSRADARAVSERVVTI
jgi:pimeloyl-ACP methyl ester carboxylesterase